MQPIRGTVQGEPEHHAEDRADGPGPPAGVGPFEHRGPDAGPASSVLVITKANVSGIPETPDFLKTMGVNAVMVNRFNMGGTGLRHVRELALDRATLKIRLPMWKPLPSPRHDQLQGRRPFLQSFPEVLWKRP